jgi:hypothetical protein
VETIHYENKRVNWSKIKQQKCDHFQALIGGSYSLAFAFTSAFISMRNREISRSASREEQWSGADPLREQKSELVQNKTTKMRPFSSAHGGVVLVVFCIHVSFHLYEKSAHLEMTSFRRVIVVNRVYKRRQMERRRSTTKTRLLKRPKQQK